MKNNTPTARSIVDQLFGRDMTREIWTGNYDKVLPLSIQDFDLTAVLPAVFYMFRFGQRRGKGKFLDTFASSNNENARERKKSANIARIARQLAVGQSFVGFDGEIGTAVLGDMLLCFCLENARHALGREEQVQRVAPAHYMASWIDLPDHVSHLRFVPEMIVAMLANQPGQYVQANQEDGKTWFAVGREFESNVLLRVFHKGVERKGELGSRTADKFNEASPVGLDQLLMIRLAQELGAAPEKLYGKEGERIPNQRPIAAKAAREFSEDIRRFVRSYAEAIPRHAFVEILESCMAVGLTTILTSVAEILFQWAASGQIPRSCEQGPASLLVDCSNGLNRQLRSLAEQSMDDFIRRIESLPLILMVLRLLDRAARHDPRIKKLNISSCPDATEWLNLLGDLSNSRRDEATMVLYELERRASELAERLEQDYPETAELLRGSQSNRSAVWRLAEALTSLLGRENTQSNLMKCIDGALLLERPNGLASKRIVMRIDSELTTRKRREVRSLVFTDSALDYLVHLHTLTSGNRDGICSLSYQRFLRTVRDRYGFCVDEAPPGMAISNESLQANRTALERRLRDLGLLFGVNDAESMKRLRPRFIPVRETAHATA